MSGRRVWQILGGVVMAAALAGCRSVPRVTPLPVVVSAGLTQPVKVSWLKAACLPPVGWTAEPLKSSDNHKHQVWLSPSGNTAYGVIHFELPWPVGAELALRGYLRAMKQSEGEAILVRKERDPQLPGLRFEAEGGLYYTRNNLIVQGWEGWVIYAGTLRQKGIVAEELRLAEEAREQTRVGAD